MNNFEYKSFFIWSILFVSIVIVLLFSYFNFIHENINGRDQLAQIITTNSNLSKKWQQKDFPVIKQNIINDLSLSAESYISVSVTNDGLEKILVEKNKDKQLPIASITKLMTAIVASEKYKLDDIVTISKNALNIDSISGIYKPGDRFFFYNALRAMLVASHNEMAAALADQTGTPSFIESMNKKATELGLLNTRFVNETGLDPKVIGDPINHSTVLDIYKLARYIKENNSDIFYITSQNEFDLFNIDKNFIGTIKNTDKLLTDQEIPFHIIGGKTGETDLAKQNLVVVTEAPCGGKIFNIVLGSQNRFEDMKKLLQYVNNSYDWSCSNL
ncbi:MAG: D-alanyl-D-alanine carboxypeptidase family protein [Minisyncoccota bacterium]